MMRQSPDLSSLQDIDLSSYSEHFREYVRRIESRLGKPIRFIDLASHHSPKESETHVDIKFCVQLFPVVWVDCEQLKRTRNREALLAHEATHIELALVEGYPLICPKMEALKAEAKRVQRILRMLTDLVVEERLAAFGFDRSEDFEHAVNIAVREEREGKDFVPAYTPPQLREFFYAFDLAGWYLNRHCKSRHKSRLRKVYKRKDHNAVKRADEIIRIVKSTPNVFEPEGLQFALKQIAAMFDLDKVYIIRTAADIHCPNHRPQPSTLIEVIARPTYHRRQF